MPLHSAHILCRTPPHKCGFLLMTFILHVLTQSNSSLPVTKDTATVYHKQFYLHFLKLFLDYVLAHHLVSKIFFWLDSKLMVFPHTLLILSVQSTPLSPVNNIEHVIYITVTLLAYRCYTYIIPELH